MRFQWLYVFPIVLAFGSCDQSDGSQPEEAEDFCVAVLRTFFLPKPAPNFPFSPKTFAIDNGKIFSSEEVEAAWPKVAKAAVAPGADFSSVFESSDFEISAVKGHPVAKKLAAYKGVYSSQAQDYYFRFKGPKAGKTSLVKYEKAFELLVHKVKGQWTLIAIGG